MKYEIPISVIMPVRQGELFIEEAIGSILRQTFPYFELIIINDASTDKTEEIIKKNKDPRIRYEYAVFSNNYKARNLGISLSKGKYICMMDADDVSLPSRLEEQFNFLEKNRHIDILGSQMDLIDERGTSIHSSARRPIENGKIKVWLLMTIPVPQPTLMFRSHLCRKHDFWYNTDFVYAGDYDFIVRVSQRFRMANLEKPLVRYRKHFGQISKDKSSEQTLFANKVREMQLEAFDIDFSKEERNLHLKLMTYRYIGEKEMLHAENWLNRLLEANHKKKYYSSKHLYSLFEFVLSIALKKSSLGGWAIEKELLHFVEENFPKDGKILEFGSGIGTEALLTNFNVTSIEHNKKFMLKRGNRHKIIHAPITMGWYDKKELGRVLKENFDLIIIDGPPEKLRQGIIKNLELFKNITIPIIFDDMDRELDHNIMETFCKIMGYEYKLMRGDLKMFAVCKPRDVVEGHE